MLFALIRRILKLDRSRLRGMSDATDEFTLAPHKLQLPPRPIR